MPPRPDKGKFKLRKIGLDEKEEIFRDYYERQRIKRDPVAYEAQDKKSPLRAITMVQLKRSQSRLASHSHHSSSGNYFKERRGS
jgi:hypothetical protein